MNKPAFSLITLEYLPDKGGVANYLGGLVRASNGVMEVIRAEQFFRHFWPRWWPMVGRCFAEGHKGRIIFVSHVFPVGTAAWIARLFGGPEYVVLFHGMDIQQVKSVWKTFLFRRICKAARVLIVNSEVTKVELQKRLPSVRPIVLRPAIDPVSLPSREEARTQLQLRPDQHVVLSCARLVKRKGIDMAIRAMAEVQKHQDVLFCVIGEGPDRERLETIAKELDVQVQWMGECSDEEKWRWFAAADIFVLPVRSLPDDLEGFGIVFLEAALAGIPVMAGRTGGVEEAVVDGQTGILVDPEDPIAIQEAIIKLLADEELRQRMGEQGRSRVLSKFRWEDRWGYLLTRLSEITQ